MSHDYRSVFSSLWEMNIENLSTVFMQFCLHVYQNVRKTEMLSGGQGWITSVYVRDLMTRAGANGLGIITNLEKMAIY